MELEIIKEIQAKDIEIESEIVHFHNDENLLQFYIQRLKLAVAVAVIRSTPSEMTPEKYAIYLVEHMNEDMYQWKNNRETFKRGLFVLTQKVESMKEKLDAMREKFNMLDLGVTLRQNMEPNVIEETRFSAKVTENETGIIHFQNDEYRLRNYVQRLKVAVAVAVIRSTPPEMTPEKYATYLNQRIKDASYKWKNKCENLEKELIVITQKLETMAMKDKFNMPDMDVTLRRTTASP